MRIAAALLVVLVALWPTTQSLIKYWREIQDYQHGFLIAPLALVWLGWMLRRIAPAALRTSLFGLGGFAGALMVWVVAQRAGFDIVHQAMLPVVLLCAVWAVGGLVIVRQLAPAILLLYFAIPLWDYLLPVLQRLSIFATEHLLALLGVPATITEYRVTIPEGTFAIVEGCSGKRYLIVTLAVAWLMAWLSEIRGKRLAQYLLICAALALVFNWVRIAIVIYAGHVTNMQHYLVAVEHLTLGNVIFLVLLAAVLALGRWLEGAPLPAQAASQTLPEGSGGGAQLPAFKSKILWVVLLLAVAAALIGRITYDDKGSVSKLGQWPLATGDWQGPLPTHAGWKPHFAASQQEQRSSYVSAAGTVEVYANRYPSPKPGIEMIQYGNNIAAPEGWNRSWSGDSETINSRSGALSAFTMEGPDSRLWLVAYTYRANSHAVPREISTKLLVGWLGLFGPVSQGLVALGSPCEPGNCDKARALITDFWENNGPSLLAMIPAKVDFAP